MDSRVGLFGLVKYSTNPPPPEIPSLKNPFTSSKNRPALEPVLVGAVNPSDPPAVADPSAPNAFVNGVMEGVEWVYDAATNSWQSQAVIEEVVRTGNESIKKLNENSVKLFEKFLNTL